MPNNNYTGDPDLQRLCNDAMQDLPLPPSGFRDREEWERYNEEQDRRDRNRSIYGIKDI
jgi:hypothetical protein